jgi:indole-3-acetate monooxygenase
MTNSKPQLCSPDDFHSVAENARALEQYLRDRSDEIETSQRISADVIGLLVSAGAFRIDMPDEWGGPQMTPSQQVEVVEVLSAGDASVGWCAASGSDSGVYAGLLNDAVARDLYPHLDVIQASSMFSSGIAEEVKGGYKVSGQWQFSSGITHADLVAADCVVYRDGNPVVDEQGNPALRTVLAPVEHWRVEAKATTTGLVGTASFDFTTLSKYLVVPVEHSFVLGTSRQGARWQGKEVINRKLTGVPLGAARRAIDDVLAHNPRADMAAVAECEMLLAGARAYVYQALDTYWTEINRDSLQLRQYADVVLSRLHAFQSARTVCRILYDCSHAVRTGVLDRALRDTETMCQHPVARRDMLDVAGTLIPAGN